jgi:hypothetical protein
MTRQTTLGPLMTLILTLTAGRKHAADVIYSSRAGVMNSLLFARLVIEVLKERPAGSANPTRRACRIGTSQASRVSSLGVQR